jgi:hypothetical protein
MAATSATLEEAAAIFRTSVDTIENKCKRLGIQLKRRSRKRPIRRLVELGLKVKKWPTPEGNDLQSIFEKWKSSSR